MAHFTDEETKAFAQSHMVSRQGRDSNPVGMTPISMIAIIISMISSLSQAGFALSLSDRSIYQKVHTCTELKLASLQLHTIASSPQPSIRHLITSCLLLCSNCLLWFLPSPRLICQLLEGRGQVL